MKNIVKQWQEGALTAEQAMTMIAAELTTKEEKKITKKKPSKRSVDNHDVSGFLRMANAIVDSRKVK